MEPDNDNRPLEFWLDQVAWPAADVRMPARLLHILDERLADMPPSFIIPSPFTGRNVAFGARGLLMTALALGLCAGAATAGALGDTAARFIPAVSVSTTSSPILATVYEGDGL